MELEFLEFVVQNLIPSNLTTHSNKDPERYFPGITRTLRTYEKIQAGLLKKVMTHPRYVTGHLNSKSRTSNMHFRNYSIHAGALLLVELKA